MPGNRGVDSVGVSLLFAPRAAYGLDMSLVERSTGHGAFTWSDIAGDPADGLRREIIGGVLIVNPAPAHRHQRISHRLAILLEQAVPEHLEVLAAPFDWRYDDDNVVEPDLLVCRVDDLDLDGPLRAPAVPVLLVEILSPSNAGFDRLVKRELYERLGVAHYWIVDPGAPDRGPRITALSLGSDGRYTVEREVAGAERFSTERPVAMSFTPADLLER